MEPSVRDRDEETGPECAYAGIGKTFELDPMVEYVAPVAVGADGSSYIYPNQTLQNVHLSGIHTVVPFVFYLLGALNIAIMLASLPVVFCAGHFAIWFHGSLAGVSEPVVLRLLHPRCDVKK